MKFKFKFNRRKKDNMIAVQYQTDAGWRDLLTQKIDCKVPVKSHLISREPFIIMKGNCLNINHTTKLTTIR